MLRAARRLTLRPRMATSCVLGIAAALLVPGELHAVTRALFGWNVAVWLYLVLIFTMMLRADHEHLRRTAMAHAEGASMVLGAVVAASIASLVGIVVELSHAKLPGTDHAVSHVLFALATVAGSWLLLPTLFTLSYASAYHTHERRAGLQFPGMETDDRPGYSDFLYFSFTIAVAAQTSDVAVTTPAMRRLVGLQSVLSFVFNTAILALSINIAASLL